MKDIHQIISELRGEIESVFQHLNHFLLEKDDLNHRNKDKESWNLHQILEHVSLTNHYLLKLILKGSEKAIRKGNQRDLEKELIGYDFNTPDLEAIGDPHTFRWQSPVHMLPVGIPVAEISNRFRIQQQSLMQILEKLKNGEGILQKTTMSVYQLGKLDVYQYIHFLLLHARRHIEQMEKLKNLYNSQK